MYSVVSYQFLLFLFLKNSLKPTAYSLSLPKMKKNIAIAMGGYSQEYPISIKSGNIVFQHLPSNKYNLYRIVFEATQWYWLTENDTKVLVDKSNFTVKDKGEVIKFDAVFNTIHGSPGEDGLLQAYLDLLSIPQTSCGFYQSAVTFNKRDCISVLQPYQIPTAKNYFVNKGDTIDVEAIVNTVSLPCFVKANRSGSSFGVVKAHRQEDVLPAINEAFEVDDQIIIESFLSGTEISVGVGVYRGKETVFGITEIVTENDFFDFQAKYEGKSEEITPARLSNTQNEEVETLALKIYKVLDMKGFARIDFIFNEGNPHFVEINTNPGLSEASILPQQAVYKGISLTELFDNEIEECLKA